MFKSLVKNNTGYLACLRRSLQIIKSFTTKAVTTWVSLKLTLYKCLGQNLKRRLFSYEHGDKRLLIWYQPSCCGHKNIHLREHSHLYPSLEQGTWSQYKNQYDQGASGKAKFVELYWHAFIWHRWISITYYNTNYLYSKSLHTCWRVGNVFFSRGCFL